MKIKLLNLFNIKKDPTLRTLLEVLIPKLGENLGLDKDFSYKDLFYCIYERDTVKVRLQSQPKTLTHLH